MVYRKAKQKVRRVYSRGKSLFGGDILKNPAVIGTLAGVIKNAATGKKIKKKKQIFPMCLYPHRNFMNSNNIIILIT